MQIPIGPDHWLEPLLAEAVDAALGDWGLQFGTVWTARSIDTGARDVGVDLDAPRTWMMTRLGLCTRTLLPLHVWVSEEVPRSIIAGLGFVELPDGDFGEEGVGMLAELSNLMAGSMSRVMGEHVEGLRITQRVGDIETRLLCALPPCRALGVAACDAVCTFRLEASDGQTALLRFALPRAAVEVFERDLGDAGGQEVRRAA
ncbi:hypothetical protein Pla163_04390 [Planctomycetes bacterium Pla163]|uniref:Chemotaxis phosphatase CheX-like domain-containing protein n=1 Tax=Rohdeia mirabilis TaxID=2528008 RepID=A0A518CVV6_9BACT|nr:hypothetical protein Pla163_04390 [Planctomycetes bacterium Pla163]